MVGDHRNADSFVAVHQFADEPFAHRWMGHEPHFLFLHANRDEF